MFKKSLKINQDIPESHYMIGKIYFELNSYNLAEEEFKKAIDLNPKFKGVHYELAPSSDCEPKLTLRAITVGRSSLSAMLFSAGIRRLSHQWYIRLALLRNMS